MIVALPTEIARSFMHRFRYIAEVGGNVMFESLAANVFEQFL
jgi:hypothetical protein